MAVTQPERHWGESWVFTTVCIAYRDGLSERVVGVRYAALRHLYLGMYALAESHEHMMSIIIRSDVRPSLVLGGHMRERATRRCYAMSVPVH